MNRRSAAFGGETRLFKKSTGAEAEIREMEEDEAVARRAPNAAGLNDRDRTPLLMATPAAVGALADPKYSQQF